MVQDPGAIREAIAETRAEMAETIEALGRKADVKGRVHEKVSTGTDHAKEALRDTAGKAGELGRQLGDETKKRPLVAAAPAVVVVALMVLLLLRRRHRD